MLIRNTVKLIKSLQQKKYRREHALFVVEGGKSVQEVLASDWPLHSVYATAAYLPELAAGLRRRGLDAITVKAAELADMGSYEHNDSALAVLEIPLPAPIRFGDGEYVLVLDDIRDPGNLGTIIRTADWFGIRQIICSPETADLYNPKVLAASMGSFLRVQVHYTALPAFLQAHADRPSYGAFLDGTDVHRTAFEPRGGLLVIGNEAHGIQPELAGLVTHRITIPAYGQAESLNAGIATAILLDNWRQSAQRS
ncbi:RNA methyltransferase [Permianibacter sp. IMCC34836]|uniref:RNA methyltransferase n=1 Tax=Permianibacter fluminis TaxID=2738515 RepID=UPI001555015D|nr:RNA methyltransferase [Permianibacter fluminis]NQD35772.1 RNA methyltransferase [Permianibacter fluminis]